MILYAYSHSLLIISFLLFPDLLRHRDCERRHTEPPRAAEGLSERRRSEAETPRRPRLDLRCRLEGRGRLRGTELIAVVKLLNTDDIRSVLWWQHKI